MAWLRFDYRATTLADESGWKATVKANTEAKKEVRLASISRPLIAPTHMSSRCRHILQYISWKNSEDHRARQGKRQTMDMILYQIDLNTAS
jgi:hypothetical protein